MIEDPDTIALAAAVARRVPDRARHRPRQAKTVICENWRDQISKFLCCNQIVFNGDEAETIRPIMINLERVDSMWPNARHPDRTIVSFEGHRITIDRPFEELARR
jgi:hypothetical protein